MTLALRRPWARACECCAQIIGLCHASNPFPRRRRAGRRRLSRALRRSSRSKQPTPQAATVQSVEQPMQSSAGQHSMELSTRPRRPFPGRCPGRRPARRFPGRYRRLAGGLARERRRDARHPPDACAITRRSFRPPTARSRPRRTKLERIEIGDITVYDVPALVLPDEALSQNLLGVSFLSRLRRYEVANGRWCSSNKPPPSVFRSVCWTALRRFRRWAVHDALLA